MAGTRVACDQPLNELPANKRTDVWMIKYGVERHLKILLRGLTSRNRDAVQDILFPRGVVTGYAHHRLSPVLRRVQPNGRAWLGKRPAGGGRRLSKNRILIISCYWDPERIEF